jgi:hypothetical protein
MKQYYFLTSNKRVIGTKAFSVEGALANLRYWFPKVIFVGQCDVSGRLLHATRERACLICHGGG